MGRRESEGGKEDREWGEKERQTEKKREKKREKSLIWSIYGLSNAKMDFICLCLIVFLVIFSVYHGIFFYRVFNYFSIIFCLHTVI